MSASRSLRKLFGDRQPIIGMVHLDALPGSFAYDASKGMKSIRDKARRDAAILQDEGVDAVLFCNENDRPYSTQVGPATVAAMTDVVTRAAEGLRIPFGVDILWDHIAAIAVANAVGAHFVRGAFTGVYASDMGLYRPSMAAAAQLMRNIGATELVLFANIVPEFSSSLDSRPLSKVARSVVTYGCLDVLLVSGLTAGQEVDLSLVRAVKAGVPEASVLVNTGSRPETLERILQESDGVVVGSYFKRDGITWNEVDPARVRKFMDVARKIRGY